MQIDLSTLWYLTIGTLVVGAAMTLWERQAHRYRVDELGIWAASYLVFALGCVVAMTRGLFPGTTGWALTNLLMVSGYLMVLHGVARLDGRGHALWSAIALVVLALVWTVAGARFTAVFWNYLAAVPIAATCGLTAWTLLRSRTVRSLRSRLLAVAIFAGHGLFYLVRALVTPLLVARYGDGLLPVFAKTTMYEAVLYSVAMSMALLALVREEAQNQLLVTARTDYLTGLNNRHGFFEHGARILSRQDHERPVSLLAFDLDHFKAINDRYGHTVGDGVLSLFASIARDTAGPDAVLGRLGGEEFAALLPGRGVQAAQQIGHAIARRFAEEAARDEGLGIGATVSIGLVETRPGRSDLSELLSVADRALYRAKALGRNRIETAEPVITAAAA